MDKNFQLKSIYFLLVLYLAFLFLGMIARSFFGVDFTDEAFYVALIYHYIQGAKPFLDESSLAQIPALLVYPVFKLYVHFQGTQSIVLFARIFYVFFSALFAALLGFCFKKELGYPIASLIFVNLILFAFSNIFTPSYYTFLLLFLTTALFLLCYAQAAGYLMLGGLAAFLMVAVYPTMGLLLPIILILLVLDYLKSRKTSFYLVGFAIGMLGFTFILLRDKALAALVESIQFIQAIQAETNEANVQPDKIFHPLPKLIAYIQHFHLYFYLLLGLLFVFAYCFRWLKRISFFETLRFWFYAFLLACGWVVIFLHPIYPKTHCFLIMLIVFSGLAVKPLVNTTMARRLFWTIYLPSILAGFIIVWSSNVPYLAWVVGLFPAMLVSLVYWVMWSKQVLKKYYLVFALPLLIGVNLSFMTVDWFFFYREPMGGIKNLTTQVKTGPYAKMYTTPIKATFIQGLQQDLAPYVNKGYSLFTYYNLNDFSAAYLIEGFTIDTNSVWFSSFLNTELATAKRAKYFQTKGLPDIVVRMFCFPSSNITCSSYPSALDLKFAKAYQSIVHNQNYTILQKRGTS